MAEPCKYAESFTQMCLSFDSIAETYKRKVPFKQQEANYPQQVVGYPYLKTHLQFMLTGSPQRVATEVDLRTGGMHTIIQRKNKDDYRLALPSTIVAKLLEQKAISGSTFWTQDNVTATWIVCYLSGIKPDESKTGWIKFECSHRCTFNRQPTVAALVSPKGWLCVTPRCLVWESKADNQSRGNDFCSRKCKHSDCLKSVCACNGIHFPACI